MDGAIRKPFQGVSNIIRFNWHFYLLAIVLLSLLFFIAIVSHYPYNAWAMAIMFLIILPTVTSLAVSWYVYDASKLYGLPWLETANHSGKKVVNINAGFDETSHILTRKFPNAEVIIFDFFDPQNHTEISIKRARKAYPAYANTQHIKTEALPLPDNYADIVCLTFAAHEIRGDNERKIFFSEVKRILKPGAHIFLTEHLRGTLNFLAYNIGFFHFLSFATWCNTFKAASLKITKVVKTTPFVTTFILE